MLYGIILGMNRHEFNTSGLQPTNDGIDLNTRFTEDYHLDHTEEINEALLSMEDESKRKPEMENDASLKASKIHEEVIFHKGEKYQKMVSRISSALDGDGAILEIPDNISLRDKENPLDYLIAKCLRLDHDSKEAICQAVSDGIFDIIGLEEDRRPVLSLITSINGRVSKYEESTGVNDNKNELGYFREPIGRFHHINPLAKENGIIRIKLPNFDDEPDIRDILATLEHECFHVYQFNCRRGVIPIVTVRDRIMMAAYSYGNRHYISPKNDYEGYYNQGYESSARSFSSQLVQATHSLITDAFKQIIEHKDKR